MKLQDGRPSKERAAEVARVLGGDLILCEAVCQKHAERIHIATEIKQQGGESLIVSVQRGFIRGFREVAMRICCKNRNVSFSSERVGVEIFCKMSIVLYQYGRGNDTMVPSGAPRYQS